jgi:hypothetical protein
MLLLLLPLLLLLVVVCCRYAAMDELWVPSEWQRQTFINSGVNASKVMVVPEVRESG